MGLYFSEDGDELWVLRPIGRDQPLPASECDADPLSHPGRLGAPCWPVEWVADVFGRDGRLLGVVTPDEAIATRSIFTSIILRAFIATGDRVYAETVGPDGDPFLAEYDRR